MGGAPLQDPRSAAPLRTACRVLVEYAIGGDLRYLAHHDELRMLTRALVRAGWPLAYSGGFNPRPRLTLPLPRNLGVAAESQIAIVNLTSVRPSAELAARLAAQLPAGCRLLQVVAPAAAATPHPRSVVYEVTLATADVPGLAERGERLLRLAAVPVMREGAPGRPVRPFDIRPYLLRLEVEGGELRMVLGFADQRTARPAEVLTALGLAAARYNHCLRRSAVHWDLHKDEPLVGLAVHERTELGNEKNHSKASPRDA